MLYRFGRADGLFASPLAAWARILLDQFEAHEAQVIGAGRHEELHALLEQLLARYPAPAAAHAH